MNTIVIALVLLLLAIAALFMIRDAIALYIGVKGRDEQKLLDRIFK